MYFYLYVCYMYIYKYIQKEYAYNDFVKCRMLLKYMRKAGIILRSLRPSCPVPILRSSTEKQEMMKLQCEVAKNHHRMVFLQHRSVLGVLFVLEHRPWCSIGAPGCPNAWCSEDTKNVSVGHPCFNSVNLCDPVSQIYAILCHNICDRVPNIDDVTNLCDPVSQIYAILCHNICDPVSQIYAMLQIYAILCHKYVRCYTRLCDPVSQICAMLHASMRSCVTNIFDVTRVYEILVHKYIRCYTRLCDTVSRYCFTNMFVVSNIEDI